MKVVHMFSFLSLLLVMLTGCSNNKSASLIKDHKFGLHAQGEFYRFNKAEQIGIYSTGPITIEFETAETTCICAFFKIAMSIILLND